jgi:NAD(P)-dependent dehydrogenase (short-subunit alcohol dehydrogenase family)
MAIARSLRERSHRVALIDVDPERLQSARASLAEAGVEAHVEVADVTDYDAVTATVRSLAEAVGTPEILVNCVGYSPKRDGSAPEPTAIEADEWNQVLSVNLTAAFHVTRAVLPGMRQARFGRIVNVSSTAARTGTRTAGVHYAAAKAGLLGLTRALAWQVARHGILVNAVAPGKFANPRWPEVPEELDRYLAAVPLGRLAEPSEVAEVVAFLCDDSNTYVTGATIDVDGGRLAR